MTKSMHTPINEIASAATPETGEAGKAVTPKKERQERTRAATARTKPAPSKVAQPVAKKRQASPSRPAKAPSSRRTSNPKKTAPSSAGPRRVKGREFPPGTKAAIILSLLRRSGGVTIAQLMNATGWQAHSVRGFLSGVVKTELKLKLNTSEDSRGKSRYSVKT